MSSGYDLDILQEAGEEAVDEFIEEVMAILGDSMGEDGEVPGMVLMSPGDRIAQFQLDARSGQLDALRTLNQKHYEARFRQYLEDIKNSPFVAHTFEFQGAFEPPPPPLPRVPGYKGLAETVLGIRR